MSTAPPPAKPALGDPAWEVAQLFPVQGDWTEEDYLALPGNHLVELSDGWIEVLPMPATSHQRIVRFLIKAVLAFIEPRELGELLFAPLRVRLWKGKIREPDLVFMLAEHADRIGEKYWQGADLAMEVVSGDGRDRDRDLEVKRLEYARAKIAEYWIIDPEQSKITVLRLAGGKYKVHGQFSRGSQATSALLAGFEVEVDKVLAGK